MINMFPIMSNKVTYNKSKRNVKVVKKENWYFLLQTHL